MKTLIGLLAVTTLVLTACDNKTAAPGENSATTNAAPTATAMSGDGEVEKTKLRSLLHYSGLPISSTFIVEGVLDEVRPRPKQEPLEQRA